MCHRCHENRCPRKERVQNDLNKIVGHYVGYMDLNPIGNPRYENIQFLLNKDGNVTLVTDEDGLEMESTSLGSWKLDCNGTIKFTALQYTTGQRLCAILPVRPDNICQLIFAGCAKVDCYGNMVGNIRVTVRETQVGEETKIFPIEVDIPLFQVRKIPVKEYFNINPPTCP